MTRYQVLFFKTRKKKANALQKKIITVKKSMFYKKIGLVRYIAQPYKKNRPSVSDFVLQHKTFNVSLAISLWFKFLNKNCFFACMFF